MSVSGPANESAMDEPRSITKITAILSPRHTDTVITALRQGGITDIYIYAGRAPVLRENGGLMALLSGQRALASNLVDILLCFVEPTCELPVMHLIAQKGQLTRPGMGSLYSETYCLTNAHPLCRVNAIEVSDAPDIAFYHDLVGIYCVVQRGQGDGIARVVLEMGAAVPTITYGMGMGIRDRLGLLRITIPAEKEVLNLIVPAWDAEEVLDAMITAGRLELPGRGFISTFPVRYALMNTRMSTGRSSSAAASLEQITAAIDTLKGSTTWRAEGKEFPKPRRHFFGGRDIHVICNEGTGVELVKAAMSAGGTGATMEKMKLLPSPDARGQQLSPAREVCRLMVSEASMPAIICAMENAGALSDAIQAMLYHGEAPKAFTYTTSRK